MPIVDWPIDDKSAAIIMKWKTNNNWKEWAIWPMLTEASIADRVIH
jgi:hypothetical protein